MDANTITQLGGAIGELAEKYGLPTAALTVFALLFAKYTMDHAAEGRAEDKQLRSQVGEHTKLLSTLDARLTYLYDEVRTLRDHLF